MSRKSTQIERYYLPALRGLFGDWVYYVCMMTISQVVERIQYADDIHNSKKLSDMIQRKLDEGRSKKIAEYLIREEQHFFNSLVVALYGGDPSWHALAGFQPVDEGFDVDNIPDAVEDSVGFLSFTGEEKIFALDGQHRLAGMRRAIKNSSKIQHDEVPLIIVSHQRNLEGERRTRRLLLP